MNAQDYACKAESVFVLPDAVTKIKGLIDDDAASMQEIAEVIKYDPAIMSRVLKISNSALYGFPSKISTVTKAIQVIGVGAVYDLVLAYGTANAFKGVDAKVIDLDRFWEQSVSCALLARYFAEELSLKEPERLFVCGLLHNIGELVVTQFSPEIAKKCQMTTTEYSPLQLQIKHLGFSYGEVGAKLLSLWGIPLAITGPINRQHVSLSEAKTPDDKIIQLAYILALNNASEEQHPAHNDISAELYESLEIDLDCLERAMNFTNLQLMGALALFHPGIFTAL
ncbi:MAG: HD-like signal output (HDOD) protein [Paraglaciecola sp.]|jgi:HD-like signal output (HDOD) protein